MKAINNILKTSEEEVCTNSKLEQLSNQFYTTIPHTIGMVRCGRGGSRGFEGEEEEGVNCVYLIFIFTGKEDPEKHVIRTLPHLQAKQELLQLMRDMLSVLFRPRPTPFIFLF